MAKTLFPDAYTDKGESGWGSEWDKKGTSAGIVQVLGSLLPMNTVPTVVHCGGSSYELHLTGGTE